MPLPVRIGKLFSVSNHSAHSRALRKGRYSEPGRIYFVTSRCHKRNCLFNSSRLAQIVISEFDKCATEGICRNLAFVVMPDHIHWLLQVRRENRLQDIVRKLKGRSARRINLRRISQSRVWQPGFHDRALRSEGDIEGAATYLIQNPLRAGLVKDFRDYPFWWSVWNFDDARRG